MNPNYNYSDPYFTNNVKFTGSAFEFPDEARTIMLYLATLLFMIIWINDFG
jgi:hypothetical protein